MPKICSNLNIYHRIHVLFTIKKTSVFLLTCMDYLTCNQFHVANLYKTISNYRNKKSETLAISVFGTTMQQI